jgi:hypothetical protein
MEDILFQNNMPEEKKEEKSPLLENQDELNPRPVYSEEEENYIKGLRQRMKDAKTVRDGAHDEFDGMDYITHYEANERLANTYIQPKRNKEDTNFQSGVVRQKLFALLSAITNLDLRGDISAFNADGFEIQAVGDGMEDIILKTNELDIDDEKKFLRHYELLKHGTVFVEEMWDEKFKKSKKPNKKFDGKLKDFNFTEQIKKAFARPTRTIIPGINVYLGDITKYDVADQPFIFTVDIKPYSEAEKMFGKWERWNNVPKKLERFDTDRKTELFNHDWTLLQIKEGYVEILRYQDKWNNEYALMLNGVLMTPVGMPFPWETEDYNIAQQNLEPINAKFAYGKSLVSRVKNKVALLDEMMRMAILKTQKSFMPPYLNISGRVVSNRVFMPGKISHGIPPNTLIPVNDKESQGVTNSELAMIQELQTSIDAETTSPTFSGQQASGNPTATEIIELQRQAKMVLGQTIFAISMLEWKLEWLRLKNLLVNWFNEEDQIVDKARGILKSKFRKVTSDYSVPGEGMGKRIVIPSKEIPSSEAIMQAEDILTEEQGMPIRLIFLNPEEVCSAKIIWQIVITPKERKSSEVNKLMFRAFMQDVMVLNPNLEYLQEEMANVWEKNPQKLFAQNPVAPGMNPDGTPIVPEAGSETLSPRVKLPTAEKAVGQQINNQLKQ